MVWAIIILGVGLLIGVIIYYRNKENSALNNGMAVKRGHDFFRQIHIFKTRTNSIEEIYQKMDKSFFQERSVSSKLDSIARKVGFQNNALGGSFIATLKLQGQEDGYNIYTFQFNQWKAEYGYPSAKDELSGNMVLTSIEKAIISIDPEATITREFANVSSKTGLKSFK